VSAGLCRKNGGGKKSRNKRIEVDGDWGGTGRRNIVPVRQREWGGGWGIIVKRICKGRIIIKGHAVGIVQLGGGGYIVPRMQPETAQGKEEFQSSRGSNRGVKNLGRGSRRRYKRCEKKQRVPTALGRQRKTQRSASLMGLKSEITLGRDTSPLRIYRGVSWLL